MHSSARLVDQEQSEKLLSDERGMKEDLILSIKSVSDMSDCWDQRVKRLEAMRSTQWANAERKVSKEVEHIPYCREEEDKPSSEEEHQMPRRRRTLAQEMAWRQLRESKGIKRIRAQEEKLLRPEKRTEGLVHMLPKKTHAVPEIAYQETPEEKVALDITYQEPPAYQETREKKVVHETAYQKIIKDKPKNSGRYFSLEVAYNGPKDTKAYEEKAVEIKKEAVKYFNSLVFSFEEGKKNGFAHFQCAVMLNPAWKLKCRANSLYRTLMDETIHLKPATKNAVNAVREVHWPALKAYCAKKD